MTTQIFYDFGTLNKKLFIILNTITNNGGIPYLLEFLSNLFFIANFAVIYILACIFLYLTTIYTHKKFDYFLKYFYLLFDSGVYYALFGISFAALKFSINMPRPFCSLKSYEFITIINTDLERCLSSFPSAHTGLSIMIFYILWRYFSIIGKTLSIITVACVALSRITLAMHYPSDILYSILCTALIVMATNVMLKRKKIHDIIIKLAKYIFDFIHNKTNKDSSL